MTARIGILGGTFDPIHYGHLAIAEEARAVLKLDKVLLIPAARQPLKQGLHAATADQRFEMAKIACLSNKALEVSPIELERQGLSYTVTTLEELREREEGELHFILGADALTDLPRWYEAYRIPDLAKLVAVRRPGFTLNIAAVEDQLPPVRNKIKVLEGPRLDISSTEVRRRIAEGLPIRYQTADAVIAYIAAHRLYE